MELEKPGYNEAKFPTLSIIYNLGEITPGELAWIEEIESTAASMRLFRYYRWGLLNRVKQGRSYVYTLSGRGLERLEWLEETWDVGEEEWDIEFQRCLLIRDQKTGRVTDLECFEDEEDLEKYFNLMEKRRCRISRQPQ